VGRIYTEETSTLRAKGRVGTDGEKRQVKKKKEESGRTLSMRGAKLNSSENGDISEKKKKKIEKGKKECICCATIFDAKRKKKTDTTREMLGLPFLV